jgi:hypothetical protein
MKRIVLHIDSLALKGFRAADRQAVAHGIREQLARSLAEPGALDRLSRHRSIAALPALNTRTAAGAKPQSVGAAVGAAIGGAVKR